MGHISPKNVGQFQVQIQIRVLYSEVKLIQRLASHAVQPMFQRKIWYKYKLHHLLSSDDKTSYHWPNEEPTINITYGK